MARYTTTCAVWLGDEQGRSPVRFTCGHVQSQSQWRRVRTCVSANCSVNCSLMFHWMFVNLYPIIALWWSSVKWGILSGLIKLVSVFCLFVFQICWNWGGLRWWYANEEISGFNQFTVADFVTRSQPKSPHLHKLSTGITWFEFFSEFLRFWSLIERG